MLAGVSDSEIRKTLEGLKFEQFTSLTHSSIDESLSEISKFELERLQ